MKKYRNVSYHIRDNLQVFLKYSFTSILFFKLMLFTVLANQPQNLPSPEGEPVNVFGSLKTILVYIVFPLMIVILFLGGRYYVKKQRKKQEEEENQANNDETGNSE